MKTLQKVNSKILVLLMTLVLAVVTLFAGVSVSNAPNASADEMTYIDTEVEAIRFLQSNKVIFAFRLTECDYADFTEPTGDFPVGTARHDYITSLSYWKDFGKMNSKGVEFAQLFAYWNGGWGDSQIGLERGANAVGHLSGLERVEYGFSIWFPAGTTFPSLEYIVNGCEGTPVAYRTTKNIAFCYNGTEFVQIDYSVISLRSESLTALNTIDMSVYPQAEQQQVSALVQTAKNKLSGSVSLLDVQLAMDEFYAALAEVRTVEYYAQLNTKKVEAKQALDTFFATFAEGDYGVEEWQKIHIIKAETLAFIEAADTIDGVQQIVSGAEIKANAIVKEADKPALEAAKATAIQNVQGAFNASLYRAEEAEQGTTLVGNYVKAIELATTFDEVMINEYEALNAIEGLKTAAEWEAEEEANKKPDKPQVEKDPQPEQQPTVDEEPQKEGCFGSVNGTLVAISLAMMAALILIMKNNKKRMDF